MSQPSASGERAALRGYRWQYDHIAVHVYDALLDGNFVAIRLTDPEAGQVDDLVLIRRGRTDGYQFKSSEASGYITFGQVVKANSVGSGGVSTSLLQSLASGWKLLRSRWKDARVHLVLQQLPSVNDHLGENNDPHKPSPDHFKAFLTQVVKPLKEMALSPEAISVGWQPAFKRFEEASGLEPNDFDQFIQSIHFDFGSGADIPDPPSQRGSDIIALSDALMRHVSESESVVELDERGVLELMGWQHRLHPTRLHEFPVDLDAYAPLEDAIEKLSSLIDCQVDGYVAVVGPPGTGKSTLLSQVLTGSVDRIIRYYAYIPGSAAARTRLTARSFLHDVVVMLNESGLQLDQLELVSDDVDSLRRQFADRLAVASEEFKQEGRRTIIVVDGLDHVAREYAGTDTLLAELPRPNELPMGVLVMGGQPHGCAP